MWRGRRRRRSIQVHDSLVGAIAEGVEAGDDVYLALQSVGGRRKQVGAVLIRDEHGEYALAGACAVTDMAHLESQLGDAGASLDRIVGLSDRRRILRILMPSTPGGSQHS